MKLNMLRFTSVESAQALLADVERRAVSAGDDVSFFWFAIDELRILVEGHAQRAVRFPCLVEMHERTSAIIAESMQRLGVQ
jgi:hypothetical protein